PVFVKGNKLWEFDESGNLTGHHDPTCEGEAFSISHNVAPAEDAWGAGGCEDCHLRGGHIFNASVILDPYDESGQPVIEPVRHSLGISDFSYDLCSIHCPLVKPWVGSLIILVFFATTLHFIRYGPHEVLIDRRPDDYEHLQRFNWVERFVHLVVLFTFLFLAFTGLAFAFNGGRWLKLFFNSAVTPRTWHGYLGLIFGAGVIIMLLMWWRDSVLTASDKKWLRKLGGYLGTHEPVPAGRFNAGQKVYFWTVVVGGITLLITGLILMFKESLPTDLVFLAVVIHDLAAFTSVAGVLSHVYLGTGANPGTLEAIFTGRVTKLWARRHHPEWFEEITGEPAYQELAAPGKDKPENSEQAAKDEEPRAISK
ncbi:MAG TPA: formate dehydrogenase subunit gamma, partial [Anaerolineae bacterium]|nr:formate dehydrogenase subunit gamma [Anaerolineae bacterium]